MAAARGRGTAGRSSDLGGTGGGDSFRRMKAPCVGDGDAPAVDGRFGGRAVGIDLLSPLGRCEVSTG